MPWGVRHIIIFCEVLVSKNLADRSQSENVLKLIFAMSHIRGLTYFVRTSISFDGKTGETSIIHMILY